VGDCDNLDMGIKKNRSLLGCDSKMQVLLKGTGFVTRRFMKIIYNRVQ
jgi:hypothetical protein